MNENRIRLIAFLPGTEKIAEDLASLLLNIHSPLKDWEVIQVPILKTMVKASGVRLAVVVVGKAEELQAVQTKMQLAPPETLLIYPFEKEEGLYVSKGAVSDSSVGHWIHPKNSYRSFRSSDDRFTHTIPPPADFRGLAFYGMAFFDHNSNAARTIQAVYLTNKPLAIPGQEYTRTGHLLEQDGKRFHLPWET